MAALYQEFRPRRFSDLKGQDGISRVLKNQVIKGTPANAYLFSGPRGTGKTSSARILAMALNCLAQTDGEPCLECEHCKSLLAESFIDVVEIDAASNTGVDHARELRENINLLPLNAKHKIYIIDEVHMLTGAAFNALLKTIEEPPKYAVFILATTELRKVLPTVVSRCQRFDFKPINHGAICSQLTEICDNRQVKYDKKAIDIIADAAGGGLRDALTILDQCLAASDFVDEIVAREVLGLAGDDEMQKLASHILAYDHKESLQIVHDLIESGVSAQAIASELALEFNRLLMENMKQGKSSDALIFGMKTMIEAENDMRFSLRPALVLEWSVIKLVLPEHSPTQIEARIAKIEENLASGNFAVNMPKGAEAQQNRQSGAEDAKGVQSQTKSENQGSASAGAIDFSADVQSSSPIKTTAVREKTEENAEAKALFDKVARSAPALIKPFLRWCKAKEIKGNILYAESEKDTFTFESEGISSAINKSVAEHSQGAVTKVIFKKKEVTAIADIEEID